MLHSAKTCLVITFTFLAIKKKLLHFHCYQLMLTSLRLTIIIENSTGCNRLNSI